MILLCIWDVWICLHMLRYSGWPALRLSHSFQAHMQTEKDTDYILWHRKINFITFSTPLPAFSLQWLQGR